MKPFELLVEEHGPALLRFCAARVGAERAEDCFQETMLAALRAHAEVRDPAAVRAWLFKIATHKTVDAHRARSRTPAPSEHIEMASTRTEFQPGSNDVWDLVGTLPPKQATAIQLRYRGGLSHAEIGQAMEISEEAARRNVFEGLKTLRAEKGAWT
jgi:RNA polymerase sigma factor (sigma-70 family)